MAYVRREEEDAAQTPGMGVLAPGVDQAPTPPAEGEVIPPERISGAPGAEITGTQAGPRPTAGSGRFVNVQKYIEANRPQIEALAKRMQENVQKSRQAIQEASAKQQAQLQARIAPEQQRLAGAQEQIQQRIAEAGTREFSPEELQRFTALREGTGQFQEITPLDLSEQRLKARALEGLGQRITAGAGREQLLRETIASPRYTVGQRKLDEMLLSSDPTIRRQALENIKQTTSGVERGVAEQEREAREALGGVRQEAAAAQRLAQEQLGTARTGLQETIAARQAEEAARAPEIREEAMRNIRDVPVWARESSQLDLALPEATVSRVATPEQLARARALAQLGGYEQTVIPDAGLVGTYAGDVEQSVQQYQQSVQNLYNSFKDDTAGLMKSSPAENKQVLNYMDPASLSQIKAEDLISMANSGDPVQRDMSMKLYRAITGLAINNPGQVVYKLSLPRHRAVAFDPSLQTFKDNIQGLAQTYGYGNITPDPGQVGTETGVPLSDIILG